MGLSEERAKDVVRAYYEAMNSRDLDRILGCYVEGASTWVLGEGPFAGRHPVSHEAIEAFLSISEIRFTLLSMIAEDDTVAVELESKGTMGGRPYANRYHNRIQVRDGGVAELKEYFDTALAGG